MQLVQIYLDTNVFIEMFETKSDAASNLWALFGRAEEAGFQFITSEITLAEILIKPIQMAHTSNNWKQVHDYRMIISDKGRLQKIVSVSRTILDSAANIRALTNGIKLPDAIHLATAVSQKCSFFVSNDRPLADKCLKATPPFPIQQFVNFDTLSSQIFSSEN